MERDGRTSTACVMRRSLHSNNTHQIQHKVTFSHIHTVVGTVTVTVIITVNVIATATAIVIVIVIASVIVIDDEI